MDRLGPPVLDEFVNLARIIHRFQQPIRNTLQRNVSNVLSEAANTHIRALTNPPTANHSALVAMAMFTRAAASPWSR